MMPISVFHLCLLAVNPFLFFSAFAFVFALLVCVCFCAFSLLCVGVLFKMSAVGDCSYLQLPSLAFLKEGWIRQA